MLAKVYKSHVLIPAIGVLVGYIRLPLKDGKSLYVKGGSTLRLKDKSEWRDGKWIQDTTVLIDEQEYSAADPAEHILHLEGLYVLVT